MIRVKLVNLRPKTKNNLVVNHIPVVEFGKCFGHVCVNPVVIALNLLACCLVLTRNRPDHSLKPVLRLKL